MANQLTHYTQKYSWDDGRMPGVYMRVVKNVWICLHLFIHARPTKKELSPRSLRGFLRHSIQFCRAKNLSSSGAVLLILCCQCVSECVPIATLFSDEDDRGPNTVEFIYYRAKVCCTVKLVRPGNGQWMDATWPGLVDDGAGRFVGELR